MLNITGYGCQNDALCTWTQQLNTYCGYSFIGTILYPLWRWTFEISACLFLSSHNLGNNLLSYTKWVKFFSHSLWGKSWLTPLTWAQWLWIHIGKTVNRFGPHTLWEIACSLYALAKAAFESGMDAKLIIQSKREGFFSHEYLDCLHTVIHFVIHRLYKELQN